MARKKNAKKDDTLDTPAETEAGSADASESPPTLKEVAASAPDTFEVLEDGSIKLQDGTVLTKEEVLLFVVRQNVRMELLMETLQNVQNEIAEMHKDLDRLHGAVKKKHPDLQIVKREGTLHGHIDDL